MTEPVLTPAAAANHPIIIALQARVRVWSQEPVIIPGPEKPSGWAHLFTCRTCAIRLPWDRNAPTTFLCPACQTLHDDPADTDRQEAWIYLLNQTQIEQARDAVILADRVDDNSGLATAKAVLLGYARAYPHYREHGRWAGKGRLQAQNLDEAVWMLPACHVYDVLLQRGMFTNEEITAIRQMFAAAIQLLQPQIGQVHNIHLWIAAAISALADRLGNSDAAAFGESELQRNIDQGILPDGSWFECAPHYHYYVIEALITWSAARKRSGHAIFVQDALQRMLRAPLAYLRPDGQIALFNDGWPAHPLACRAPFYEKAEYLFGGFQDVLGEIYHHLHGDRDSLEAALYGPATIPVQRFKQPRAQVVDGIAVVRRGNWVAMIKANPYGGGHDHPDKPCLDLFAADGSIEAADLGNPGYGNPLHRAWFKTSFAHNCVLIDGVGQKQAAAQLISCTELPHCTQVVAESREAYPDTLIRRTVSISDTWVVDVVDVELAQADSVTWRFHARAALQTSDMSGPALLPHAHLTKQGSTSAPSDYCDATWTAASGRTLHARSFRPTGDHPAWGRAQGPALPSTETVDLLIAQAHGKRVCFITVFALDALPEMTYANDRLLVAGNVINLAE